MVRGVCGKVLTYLESTFEVNVGSLWWSTISTIRSHMVNEKCYESSSGFSQYPVDCNTIEDITFVELNV
jgi:hypothetical protein